MKKIYRVTAFVLAGAMLLTACSKTQESETETTNVAESSSVSVSETSETSGFNGASGGSHSTSGLTEFGRGYEGIEGTGDYNYGEALQKSVLFFFFSPDSTSVQLLSS